MPEIISIGECMIELFSDQPLEEADAFRRSLAGDTLNILVAAARLGASTGYVTRIGKDPFAGYLLNTWRKEGIDVSHVKQVDGFNAVHFVALLPGGDREFVYYRRGSAPSTMEPSDLDPQYIASARVLHVSGITQAISATARATVRRAVEIAHERGVSVSYDPNYRRQLWTRQEARKGMEEVLPYVSYFLPSAPADTEALLDTSDPREAVDAMRARGIGVVAVKCGERGSVIGVGDEVFEVPAYTPGPVVDTTGAGDAFNGGFLHGTLHGMSPRDAATLGAIAAGLKLRGRGALTAMPMGKEVYAAFESLKKQT
jgi:2-dehydro-3-deoxygluconokinase